MKKIFPSTLILVLVLSLNTPPALAQTVSGQTPWFTELAEHVPGELLIRFSPGMNSAQAANKMSEMGLTHKSEIKNIGVHLVKLPPGLTVEKAIDRFSRLPGVDFAEPNYILRIAANTQSEIVDQWGLNKMRVPQAWETLGADQKEKVLLATVDSGIDKDQSDLSSKIWYNPGEIAGNGLDDDNNGYVDDTWGWDFVNIDNNPMDDNMHGTAVSSVMVAAQDGAGMVGICPWCKVMAVKVINSQGSGSLDVVANGIIYAANRGAQVINLSLGAGAGAQTLEDAVNFAWNKGAVVVAAAGNNGTNMILYPAGYANAIPVASSNAEDKHSCFSNFGEGYISVAAPGEAIYVIDINDTTTGYNYYSGTSLATPHVSGLAGLLLGKDPGLTNAQVRSIIEDSAIDLGSPGVDAVFGHGRVDAYRAVTGDFSQVAPPDSLSSTSDTASGFPHERKLVRDSSGKLHLIWHTADSSLYRIRYATSDDNGANWNLQPDIYISPYETYHPALAADNDYLYVVFPSKSGDNLPYRTLFTRKRLTEGSWSQADPIISGNFNAVRPTIYVDPSNGRLHVIASSYDDAPYLYYRASDNQGSTWRDLNQFNASNTTDNRTIYAALHAYGDNIYVVARTVQTFLFFSYLNVFTVRSINGGSAWIDQTQISAYLAFSSGHYGISLAGVGDRVYMGYEVGTSLYFRRNDGAGWSNYLTLEPGDANNIYKWPSITQSDDGQAWMVFELNNQLYMRYYDGLTWQAKESISPGTYPNLKLGTSEDRVEWVSTTCNGSPFDLAYDSRSIAANSPPQAHAQSVSTSEGTPVNITLSGSDPDGDPLTFSVVTPPSHGVLSGTPPNLTYTPQGGYAGPDSFTFRVNDGQVGSTPATVSITITSINDPPLANNSSVTILEDTVANITLTGSDPDGDPLTFSVATTPAHGNLSGTPPGVIYTPSLNYHGSDSFTFIANDGKVNSPPGMVSITITSINDPPLANNSSVTTLQGAPVNITLTGSDPEGDPLTYGVVVFPSHGSLSGVLPNLIYTPSNGYSGADSFQFTVNDGQANSSPATVSITVTPVNDPPSIHVGDLDAQATLKPRDRWDAKVTIRVHNSAHNPVQGVTVSGKWSAGSKGSATCTTDSSGTCTVTKADLRSVSSVTFTIVNLSHATLLYNSSLNHDPDNDSYVGTTIIVYKNGPPANNPPLATFNYNCTDLTCNFDASASTDVEGSISTYSWDLGDNGSGNTQQIGHTYNAQGAYTVSLTVIDDQGASSSHSWKIFLGDIQRMHVGDLDGAAKPGNGNHWNATVHILVLSASEEPLEGVIVSGWWSAGSSSTCITDINGWCTTTLNNIENDIASVMFKVTDLGTAGWEFDYQENIDPDGESDGTLIFIDLTQIYLPLIVQRK